MRTQRRSAGTSHRTVPGLGNAMYPVRSLAPPCGRQNRPTSKRDSLSLSKRLLTISIASPVLCALTISMSHCPTLLDSHLPIVGQGLLLLMALVGSISLGYASAHSHANGTSRPVWRAVHAPIQSEPHWAELRPVPPTCILVALNLEAPLENLCMKLRRWS